MNHCEEERNTIVEQLSEDVRDVLQRVLVLSKYDELCATHKACVAEGIPMADANKMVRVSESRHTVEHSCT